MYHVNFIIVTQKSINHVFCVLYYWSRFMDTPHSHVSVLNLFTQHGWSLVTAYQSNMPLPGNTSISPADTLIFSHPNS